MTGATLAEKVSSNFFSVRLKKAIVKVPNAKAKKPKRTKSRREISTDDKIPTSLIVRILIKNSLENAKREKKVARLSEDRNYKVVGEEKDAPGGYGTASLFYGAKAKSTYIDYEKLFSYLGKFRAKGSSYSNAPAEALNISTESNSFELVGREAMDRGERHVNYFFPKAADFHANLTSLVPVAGMSSAEWEQFKLMMQLDPVMYALKSRTA